MNEPTKRDPDVSVRHLLQLLQSGEDSPQTDELLAGLSKEQLVELKELQAAAEILDACPAAMEAAVDTATMLDLPTPQGNRIRVEEPLGKETIGPYEVLETLGRGGFGVVVKACDRRLERHVALKIPRLESVVAGSDGRERFAREARLVAMLGHPAIVPVYETGADGQILYIASAFCNGGTLGQWFRDRNREIAPRLAAEIVARLCEAVQHAHVRGVIHRDLKPGNVLLHFDHKEAAENDDAIIQALRIADFGLAKFIAGDQSMTQSGATIGTPAYMSPEQARGAVGEIGERSDVYALGAMLYELLTGRPPIMGESNLATMRAIESQTPESLRSRNSEVPPDLEAICLMCLEKDPHHRYQAAQDLKDDLKRWLNGEPVAARPVGAVTRLNRWRRRNRVVSAAVFTAFAALAIGLALAIGFGIRANQASALAETKSAEALVQARMARKAVDDLQRAIVEEPMVASKGMESFRQKLLTSANEYYQLVTTQKPNDKEVLREYVEILNGLARLNATLGERSTANEIYNEAVGLMQSNFPNEVAAAANMMLNQTENLTKLRRHDDAIAVARDAVDELETMSVHDDSRESRCKLVRGLAMLSRSHSGKGNFQKADHLIDEAIVLLTGMEGQASDEWPADKLFAGVLQQKTATSGRLMKNEDVELYAPLALDLWQKIAEGNDPVMRISSLQSMSSLHSTLGVSYNSRQMREEAIEQLQKERAVVDELIELRPEVASHHAQSANQLLRHAKCLFDSDDVPGARDILTNHLPYIEQALQDFPEEDSLYMTTALCYQVSARTYRHAQDMATATSELQKAIAICEPLCEEHQAGGYIRMILATLYMEKSTYFLQQRLLAEAADECEKGLDILERLHAEEPVGEHVGHLESAYHLYGNVMNKLGRYEEYLSRSEPVSTWPRRSQNIENAKSHRLVALAGCGRLTEARAGFEQLTKNASRPQAFLNFCGLASRSAGVARPGSNEHQFFLEQSVRFLRLAEENGVLEDAAVINLLREHDDFAALRESGELDEFVK